jgi:hypothetical protein
MKSERGTSSLEPRTSNLQPAFSRLYWAVLIELAVTIAILYAFTAYFR